MSTRKERKPPSRPRVADAIAAVSVVLVLVPQAMAYAQLAGVPAFLGLYAAVAAPIAASLYASSPHLQTGPTALTSLLTLGIVSAFAAPGSEAYVAMVVLLAVIVGLVRVAIGVARLGAVAYLLSEPVLRGFTFAAGVLIFLSQLPVALDLSPTVEGVIPQSIWFASHPGLWNLESLAIAVVTIGLLAVGRRAAPLFPTVLLTVVAGVLYGRFAGYGGTVLGSFEVGLPRMSLDLPWGSLPTLLVGGTVIAVAGFAEAATIARNYAVADRQSWSPNRDFLSQGLANVASGLAGGFPVGGSFSRSAIARKAGGATRWTGLFVGLMALAAIPAVGLLAPLPTAVLGGIVMYSVTGLIRWSPTLKLWRYSRPQFLVAVTTFALAIALAPRVDLALIIGVLLSLVIHLLRETTLILEVRHNPEERKLHLIPRGVLWFGSAAHLEERMIDAIAKHKDTDRVVVHFGGLGRIDLAGAFTISRLLSDTQDAGIEVQIEGVPPQARRFVETVLRRDAEEL